MRVYLIDVTTHPATIRIGNYNRSKDKKIADVDVIHGTNGASWNEHRTWNKEMMYTSFKGAKQFLSNYYISKGQLDIAKYFAELVEEDYDFG